ncbi:MAG: DUF4381 family protein [Candidatus Babeliales bacterium]
MNKYQLYDIYGLCYQPFILTRCFWIICLISVIGTVIAAAWLRYKKRKKKMYPWDYALQELKQLEESVSVNKGEAIRKECYYRIGLTLKRYLSHRYCDDFTKKTDQEFLAYLQKSAVPHSVVKEVNTLFVQVRESVFSPCVVTEAQFMEACKNSIECIEKTIPDTLFTLSKSVAVYGKDMHPGK